MYASPNILPKRTKNTAPIDAKLTVWKPSILLNLIIPAKIKILFIKFRPTTKVVKDLLTKRRRIWIAEIAKNNPKNESGKINESSKPLLPVAKFSQFKSPKIICIERIKIKKDLRFCLAFLFWFDTNFRIKGESKIVKIPTRINGFWLKYDTI